MIWVSLKWKHRFFRTEGNFLPEKWRQCGHRGRAWSDITTRIRRSRHRFSLESQEDCWHLGFRPGKLGFELLTSKIYNTVLFYHLKPIHLWWLVITGWPIYCPKSSKKVAPMYKHFFKYAFTYLLLSHWLKNFTWPSSESMRIQQGINKLGTLL